jgi:hypothetical protein
MNFWMIYGYLPRNEPQPTEIPIRLRDLGDFKLPALRRLQAAAVDGVAGAR